MYIFIKSVYREGVRILSYLDTMVIGENSNLIIGLFNSNVRMRITMLRETATLILFRSYLEISCVVMVFHI